MLRRKTIGTFVRSILENLGRFIGRVRRPANKVVGEIDLIHQYGKASSHTAVLAVSFFALTASVMTPKKLDLTVPLPQEPATTQKIVSTVAPYTPYIDEDPQTVKIATVGEEGFLSKTELTQTTSATEPIPYTVVQGETVSQIAAKFNLHVATILEANGITPADANQIEPGRELKIPRQDVSSSTAWLDEIRKQQEAERAKRAAEQKKLAQANKKASSVASKVKGVVSVRTGGGGSGHRFPYGWCTYYVAQKRYVPWGGNASAWLGNARASGFATGSEPAAGAIVVTSESWWGHVAYVEAVMGDSIFISEMNYKGWGVVSTRTISAHGGVVRGYIY